MESPKEKWGPKKFYPVLRAGIMPPTFNLLSTPLVDAQISRYYIRETGLVTLNEMGVMLVGVV